MAAKASPFSIFHFEELDSTNTYVQEHLHQLDNLSVVTAFCQRAGRGQRGNRWLSAPGENLTFTLLLKFEEGALDVRHQMRLTALATVSVLEVLREALPQHAGSFRIKWPNDIYAGDRKICGMLIENTLEGTWIRTSAIGIGLNVNQKDFDPALVNPTSLKRLSGREFDGEALLQQILGRIHAWLPLLSDPALWVRYRQDLYRLGERREWTENLSGNHLYGSIRDVREDGRLELALDDGSVRLYAFKEISYII